MQWLRGRVDIPSREDLSMVVFQPVGLILKKILGSIKGFVNKFLQNSLRLGMIGCLIKSLGREGILVYQPRSQIVNSVEGNTMVITLMEWIIFWVLVKLGTKLEISQM